MVGRSAWVAEHLQGPYLRRAEVRYQGYDESVAASALLWGCMASEQVHLSIGGRPRVVLPAPGAELVQRIEAAATIEELAGIVAKHPDSMDAWGALGTKQEEDADSILAAVNAYACYRIGYHRGLDALRKNGWRGTQLVRWSDEPNRGFLRCLDGLRRLAGVIGEHDEEARCAEFLLQLEPDWPPSG